MEKLRFYSLWLLGIITGAFILEAAFPQIISALSFRPPLFAEMPWTMITAMFMHANASHLLQNLFALGLFGIILERIIGSRNFIILYFAGGIAGNIASFYFYPDSISLGASGAIMAVIGALAVLRPKIMIYIGGPLPMVVLAIMWIFVDLIGLFSSDNIGHAAHLAGFAVGAAYGLIERDRYSQEKEVKKKAEIEISDEYLDAWEKEYMQDGKEKIKGKRGK